MTTSPYSAIAGLGLMNKAANINGQTNTILGKKAGLSDAQTLVFRIKDGICFPFCSC